MGPVDNEKLLGVLQELDLIDKQSLEAAEGERKTSKRPLGGVLLERDLITDADLGRVIGEMLGAPFINLSEVAITPDILQIIPEAVARKQRIIAYLKDVKGLHVATEYPTNIQILQFLANKVGTPVVAHYTSSTSLEGALPLYSKNVSAAFEEIIAGSVAAAKINKDIDPPIIKIVSTIIDYAYQNNASDIHIEPLEGATLVRFRVDGILQDIVKLPTGLAPQIVTRIKVMANLRTDEHQEAQDGKIVYKTPKENLDLRISIAPITKGEKVVMRLLSERSRQFSLTDLGLSAGDLAKVTAAYKAPHGMVLSTGPTGSGKTTTLYAIMKLINRREINIMTIEDPVEYQIDNVNQIQVNPRTELTFAKGLRSIVRQDPDVILVGEIRDDETAGIAINSAMTGHLVLSSLHTNDAVTSFPRLIDMHAEPYLIASTVNVVIAQRLVRKICSRCRVSGEIPFEKLDTAVKAHLKKKGKLAVYHGKGCAICHQSGYVGRIGIFEVLTMTDTLRDAIVAKKTAADLHKIAVSEGMRTMLEDGIEKVKQGITTFEELFRATKE